MSNISSVQFGPRICPGCGYDLNAPEDIGSRGCEVCGRTLPYQPQLKKVPGRNGYHIHFKDSAGSRHANGEWGYVHRRDDNTWHATMDSHGHRDQASVGPFKRRDDAVDAAMRATGWKGKLGNKGYVEQHGLGDMYMPGDR